MAIWKQSVHLIDTTPQGELQPYLNEESFYWNQIGAAQFDTVEWHAGEAGSFDGPNVRVGAGGLGGAWGNTYLSLSVDEILGAYVTIDVDAIQRAGWGSDQIRWVVGHELGHVLGLQHTQARPALMFPIADVSDYPHLYPDDTRQLKELYNLA